MSVNTESKFTDRYQIETPYGFKDFDGIGKITDPQRLIRVTLNFKEYIDVNIGHTFIVEGKDIDVKDVNIGDTLETKDGLKFITNIQVLDKTDYVYDILDVKSKDNSYYANDIINHNCKFLGSSNTLVDGDILERIEYVQPVATKWNGLFTIFEKPQKDKLYILGVDTGKGTGRDNSVIQVLRIDNEKSVEQVAIYKYNRVDTHEFAEVCIAISKYYNNAHMMIENNGEGGETAQTIWYEYECECILNCDKKGLGIRSTKKSKLAANLNLKRYLENNWLKLNDRDTVVELSKYIEVTPNVFKAETRTTHDDCVTSLIWGLYFLTTQFFDGKDVGVKTIDDKYDLDDNDDTPLILFS